MKLCINVHVPVDILPKQYFSMYMYTYNVGIEGGVRLAEKDQMFPFLISCPVKSDRLSRYYQEYQGCIQDFFLEGGSLAEDLLCTCDAATRILVNNYFLEVQ